MSYKKYGSSKTYSPQKGQQQNKAQYCMYECGNYVTFDNNVVSKTGKKIPLEVETLEKHQCPRNPRSDNYDESLEAVPESAATPPSTMTVSTKRISPANNNNNGGNGISSNTTTGMNVKQVDLNGILYQLDKNNQLMSNMQTVMEEMRNYLQIIASSNQPSFTPALDALREEHDKKTDNDKAKADLAKANNPEVRPTPMSDMSRQHELAAAKAETETEEKGLTDEEYKHYEQDMKDAETAGVI
jgi:hypothetical protein